jgi:uncharacterized protein (TIGR00645 family)
MNFKSLERVFERLIFSSRWVLAPFFLALAVSLLALLLKTIQHMVHFVGHFFEMTESTVILNVLSVVDLTLTGSLIVIVIFSGYENFVSKIDVTEHTDWPEWMSRIDFTGLKLKLMSSLVAISGIQLLRQFMELTEVSDRDITWTVVIHFTFILSCLFLALTDRLSPTKHD